MNDTGIITFANQKGGVGKSTLCAMFATYLTGKGHSVAIFDTDPQQSIAKKRASDMEVYAGCPVPYAVYSFRLSSEPALLSLIENIRGSTHFDFVLFDSVGSLTDQGLVALFVNSDYVITPFHYDELNIPPTAETVALIVTLRKKIGPEMTARHFLIPNFHVIGAGTAEEKERWKEAELQFSKLVTITPYVTRRKKMERFSTMSEMDEQMLLVTPAFDAIYEELVATKKPER